MMPYLDFDLKKYPAQILIPFFWFVDLSKQAINDRMMCLIKKDPEMCFQMQE